MSNRVILVIEDDESVQQLVRLYLEKEGFTVLDARDGEEGVQKAESERPDLVLLDIMLPGMDGRDACREIRKTMPVPIIMLTAKGDEYDRVLGLELGADDYIAKPFSPREMVARVKAVLRRAVPEESPRYLDFKGLKIDNDSRTVEVNGSPVEMPRKEFDLLWFLASNAGRAYSREHLLHSIWGYSYLGDPRTVDTHVKRLREKLMPGPCRIKTVWGYGYKFEVGEDAE